MRRRFTLAVLCTVLPLCRGFAAEADGGEYLNVNLTSQFAPSVTRLIAEAGEPEVYTLAPGQSLLDSVVSKCHAIDPNYLRILQAMNPELESADLSALPRSMRVVFPACPIFPATDIEEVVVPQDQTFWALARAAKVPMKTIEWNRGDLPALGDVEKSEGNRLAEAIGSKGTDPRDASYIYFSKLNSLKAIKANPDIADLDKLKAGEPLNALVPKSKWSTIRLKPGVDAASLAKELEIAMRTDNDFWRDAGEGDAEAFPRAAASGFEASAGAKLVTLVQSSVAAAACDATQSAEDWARAGSLLRRVNAVNVNLNRRAIREAGILIVDSGINASSLQKIPFTVERLQSVRWRDIEASSLTAQGRGFTYGVNLAAGLAEPLRNHPDTVEGFADSWHGLSVANLASFGFGSSDANPEGLLPAVTPRIAFANVVDPVSKNIPPSVLPEALSYAERNAIPIVNMSLAANNSDAPWVNALMADNGRTLIVVAAGNEGTNLEDIGVWPARYGGQPDHGRGGQVITVGAHAGDQHLADFSNFGKTYVDLLAPGCHVPTFRTDGTSLPTALQSLDAAGTSFAAPLVSNIAAQLWTFGLSTDEIKARLLVSVDLSYELRKTVYSGGTLNPAKSLSLWSDVVELRTATGNELRFGRLDVQSLKVKACDQTPESIALRKLSIVTDPESGKRHLSFIEAEPTTTNRMLMRKSELCDTFTVTPETVELFNDETHTVERIKTHDLVDFVAAEFPAN